jgi:hypothetical protein
MAESWLAQFDRSSVEVDLPLIVLLRQARNRNAHQDRGERLLTESEIRLQLLQERAEARELHRRADAGDRQAVAQIVRGIAETELAVEKAKEKNRAEYARLLAEDA